MYQVRAKGCKLGVFGGGVTIGLACYRGAEPTYPQKVLGEVLGEVPAQSGVLGRVLRRVLGKVLARVLGQVLVLLSLVLKEEDKHFPEHPGKHLPEHSPKHFPEHPVSGQHFPKHLPEHFLGFGGSHLCIRQGLSQGRGLGLGSGGW